MEYFWEAFVQGYADSAIAARIFERKENISLFVARELTCTSAHSKC
jgi:imidazole glycerol phosphate synthase subunit HisF